MEKESEIFRFRKYFRWYVFALLFALVAVLAIYYIGEGVLTVEFVIGTMFVSFLATIVYLGTLIIELKKEVDGLRELQKSNKKK